MADDRKERYINPYTDFGLAEIAKFSPEERQDYEESVKIYRDLKNSLDTAVWKTNKRPHSQRNYNLRRQEHSKLYPRCTQGIAKV